MNSEIEQFSQPLESIKSKIVTLRGVQVILDRDIALMYGVETRTLKQAVKRNSNRFPEDFMFILDDSEIQILVSQAVIPSIKHLGGAKPLALTEQGVAALSSVLKGETAVEISIAIMRAFVEMRKIIANNAGIFQRLERIEQKQIKTDENFEKVFKALESQEKPKQGIFYNGQVFDAYTFAADMIRSAKKSLVLIDNYIDDSVLTLFSKRKKGVRAQLYTKTISKQLKLDLAKHNEQYPEIEVKNFADAHDRFLIVDETTVYHIGASLKDLGKKWFAFSKFEKGALEMLGKLGGER
jgi:hypothetical protein